MNMPTSDPNQINAPMPEITRLWTVGTKRIAAILPVKIGPIASSRFDQCSKSSYLLDISAITPAELPIAHFTRNLSWMEISRNFFNRLFSKKLACNISSSHRLMDAGRISKTLVQLPEEQLLEMLNSIFEVKEIPLLDTITDQDYVFAKINHRCWEEITSIGMTNAGSTYFRNIGSIDQDCIDSGFYEYLALCLEETARLVSNSPDQGNQIRLRSKDFSFGISLTGGNASFADDLRGKGRDVKIMNDIYPAVTIGTAAGLVGFFSTLNKGNHRWIVADGASPKNLFWECKFGSFMKRVVETSDAILFIVPPSLSGITINDTQYVKVFKIIVPPKNIDTVWALVAPVILQHVAELSREYRLTVLSQCSALSALIAMIIKIELSKSKHRSPFRFYDLGQLLDLVKLGQKDAGFWITRRDVRSHASKVDDWKDILAYHDR